MTTDMLKLERDLCRCCHAEGTFVKLAEPDNRGDQKEVYCDMLKDCLNINVTPVPGFLYDATYTICEGCILRLRDAVYFKRQVQVCEERFQDLYNKNAIKLLHQEYIDPIKEEIQDHISDEKDFSDADDIGYIKFKNEVSDNDTQKNAARKSKGKSKAKAKIKRKIMIKRIDKKIKKETEDKEDDCDEHKEQAKTRGVAIKEADRNLEIGKDEAGLEYFGCITCGNRFKKRDFFIQHFLHVHLKMRPKFRSCHICKEKFAPHLRAEHFEKVHNVPRPTCGACGKKFAFPNKMLRHQKIYHMGERNKKYQCKTCDMKFDAPSMLSKHEMKHSSLRTFKCDYCEKAFKWKNNLNIHIRMHLNDRRHVCEVCQQAFVQQSSLKYHIVKRHPDRV